jgi:hypothetical protein
MLIQLAYQINDNNENIGFIKSFEASGEECIK